MLRALDVHARHALSDATHDLIADRAQLVRPFGRRDALDAARPLLFADQNDLLTGAHIEAETAEAKR